MFRHSLNRVSAVVGQVGVNLNRSLSVAATKLVNLEVNDKSGIATLTLNRPPVNSLNLELLTDIAIALDEVESNRSKGLIITSVQIQINVAKLDQKFIVLLLSVSQNGVLCRIGHHRIVQAQPGTSPTFLVCPARRVA